uniref:Uncharacterized protein n=1 Tax=Ditylenchus dipsaci TaxID=166011 RepID=A0A915CQ34_9BILA
MQILSWITLELHRRRTSNGRKAPKLNAFDMDKYGIGTAYVPEKDLLSKLADLKQRLYILQKRITIRKEEVARRKLRSATVRTMLNHGKTPLVGNIEAEQSKAYWSTIIGRSKPYRPNNELEEWLTHVDQTTEEQTIDESADKILWRQVLKKTKPWKAPGPDGIPNYLWKNFQVQHMHYTTG